MASGEFLQIMEGDPQACLREWLGSKRGAGDALLVVSFSLPQHWLDGAPPIALTAVYCSGAEGLRLLVTDRQLRAGGLPARAQFEHWASRLHLLVIAPDQALELLPCFISKPWGREIWFSAVERRGVCRVGAGLRSAPLPWVQAVLPGADGNEFPENLVLLKVLEPSPQPVTGELYFELHETKREAYVVTDVDADAWPGGVAYIRLGFSPEKLASSPDEATFRRDYLAAVRAYEAVRRQLDKPGGGEAPDHSLPARESRLREEMEKFIHRHPLRVGDVVVVPPGLPHGLLHGVRTVEFQSPVYERKILSSSQRVLTQPNWDTEAVVGTMSLRAESVDAPVILREAGGVKVERIADFPEFEVQRISVHSPGCFVFAVPVRYGLLMVLHGQLETSGLVLSEGRALLLPRDWRGEVTPADPSQPLVVLLAYPHG